VKALGLLPVTAFKFVEKLPRYVGIQTSACLPLIGAEASPESFPEELSMLPSLSVVASAKSPLPASSHPLSGPLAESLLDAPDDPPVPLSAATLPSSCCVFAVPLPQAPRARAEPTDEKSTM
jgi:hypothetical protein